MEKKRMGLRLPPLLLAAALALSLGLPARGADAAAPLEQTAAYVQRAVPSPQVGSVGGEWAVLGLARSGAAVPQAYFETYYDAVVQTVRACGGVLSRHAYTAYSRVVLALTAIGKSPANVGGYDLLSPLGDYTQVTRQGILGPAFALLALDSGGYDVPRSPQGTTQATRALYLQTLLDRALPGGGWAGSGTQADPDVTAMALQALAPYADQASVRTAVRQAVAALSAAQTASGGYAAGGIESAESVCQVITALCALGISPGDSRFVKSGGGLLEKLASYALPDGSYCHVPGGAADEMATEQALYALAAAARLQAGKPGLYRMSDARPALSIPAVKTPDVSFSDLAGRKEQAAAQALAARGIFNGVGGGRFAPDSPLTRAQFAAILVRALGLTLHRTGAFSDVPAEAWYAQSVDTAAADGLVSGLGDGSFSPAGSISRQAAAVIALRAARLCGLDTTGKSEEAQRLLAACPDGAATGAWAQPAAAFCLQNGLLLPRADGTLAPTRPLLRGEAAELLWALLRLTGQV
jgi:hypothetical protein